MNKYSDAKEIEEIVSKKAALVDLKTDLELKIGGQYDFNNNKKGRSYKTHLCSSVKFLRNPSLIVYFLSHNDSLHYWRITYQSFLPQYSFYQDTSTCY